MRMRLSGRRPGQVGLRHPLLLDGDAAGRQPDHLLGQAGRSARPPGRAGRRGRGCSRSGCAGRRRARRGADRPCRPRGSRRSPAPGARRSAARRPPGRAISPMSLSTPTRPCRTKNGRPNRQPRRSASAAIIGSSAGTCARTAAADSPSAIATWMSAPAGQSAADRGPRRRIERPAQLGVAGGTRPSSAPSWRPRTAPTRPRTPRPGRRRGRARRRPRRGPRHGRAAAPGRSTSGRTTPRGRSGSAPASAPGRDSRMVGSGRGSTARRVRGSIARDGFMRLRRSRDGCSIDRESVAGRRAPSCGGPGKRCGRRRTTPAASAIANAPTTQIDRSLGGCMPIDDQHDAAGHAEHGQRPIPAPEVPRAHRRPGPAVGPGPRAAGSTYEIYRKIVQTAVIVE